MTIFQSRAVAHNNLATNWSTPDACTGHWHGVECSDRRVTSLVIPFLDLRGPLNQLSHLDQLCRLDLHGNRLNDTLLSLLPALPNLKLLYLSQNDLSDKIPPAVSRLMHVLHLNLSSNDLRGPIPSDALANLTHLLTLRFQNNLLSGQLSDLSSILPHLLEFNASNNQLYRRPMACALALVWHPSPTTQASAGLPLRCHPTHSCCETLLPPLPPLSQWCPPSPAPNRASLRTPAPLWRVTKGGATKRV